MTEPSAVEKVKRARLKRGAQGRADATEGFVNLLAACLEIMEREAGEHAFLVRSAFVFGVFGANLPPGVFARAVKKVDERNMNRP